MADTSTTADLKLQLTEAETADLQTFNTKAKAFLADISTVLANNVNAASTTAGTVNTTIASQFFARMQSNLNAMFTNDLSNVLSSYGLNADGTVKSTTVTTPTTTITNS